MCRAVRGNTTGGDGRGRKKTGKEKSFPRNGLCTDDPSELNSLSAKEAIDGSFRGQEGGKEPPINSSEQIGLDEEE